jgi:hypothetical protein
VSAGFRIEILARKYITSTQAHANCKMWTQRIFYYFFNNGTHSDHLKIYRWIIMYRKNLKAEPFTNRSGAPPRQESSLNILGVYY